MNRDYEITIKRGGNAARYWQDAWRLRGLVKHLARRDIVAGYKQTFVGLAWAVVRPFVSMIVFTFIFKNLADLPSEGAAPYALMVFCGLLPWQLFSTGFSRAANSLVRNADLVRRIYFPRILLIFQVMVVSLVDFMIGFALLVGLMVWFGWLPDLRVLTLPLFISLGMLTAMGAGLWLAALNVRYRDFGYLVPYLLQIGMFVSPVGFSSSVVPEHLRLLYSMNPLVGVVDGFRWALLGGEVPLYVPGLIASTALTALLLASGLWFFRRHEMTFADRI